LWERLNAREWNLWDLGVAIMSGYIGCMGLDIYGGLILWARALIFVVKGMQGGCW